MGLVKWVTGNESAWWAIRIFFTRDTVYPKKYAHGFVVLCFVVVMQSFIMNSHEVFIHIHQGCFAGTGAIVRLPQCQWSKPDGYGKISQYITTTKHSKAKNMCIFLGIYCIYPVALPGLIWHSIKATQFSSTRLKQRVSSLLLYICCVFLTLGWELCLSTASLAEVMPSSNPISLATREKWSLKISETLLGSVSTSLFSRRKILHPFRNRLSEKNEFNVTPKNSFVFRTAVFEIFLHRLF